MSFFPVSISFLPNQEKDDIKLAFKLLFEPKKWKGPQEDQKNLEDIFKKYFGVKYAFSFASGRSALFLILKALGIKRNDEIFIQAFTCSTAINPILKLGARPIFIDIKEDLNVNLEDLKQKFKKAKSPKALILQHTFGNSAEAKEAKAFSKKKGIFLIENCAHSLGLKIEGKKAGTFGEAAFFSFGRDKIISSISGGMAITNNEALGEKIKEIYQKLSYPQWHWTLRQLLYPLILKASLPIYSFFNLGKLILFFSRKLKIILPAVFEEEKKGNFPSFFEKKMPPCLAVLAQNQFKKLEKLNEHRQEIAKIYNEEFKDKNIKILTKFPSLFMRYSILTKNAQGLRKKLKKKNIILDDGWNREVIVPPGSFLEKFGYKKGTCKMAEKIASQILNLPTHINLTKNEARKIAIYIKKYGN